MWRKCLTAPVPWVPPTIITIPPPFITLASPPPPASLSPSKTLGTSPPGRNFTSPSTSTTTVTKTTTPIKNIRLYLCFFLLFVLLFTAFSLILWGASKSYAPKVLVKNIAFENFNIQAGNDDTGVATDMLSLNSTVRVLYRNPATFFGVHVTSTPLELHYYQLSLASGQMEKFYVKRKKERKMVVVVSGHQVPLYGGVSALGDAGRQKQNVALSLNLTFVVRSRAHILGSLVRSKFYRRIRCSVTLHGNKLGKPSNLTNSCLYN